MRAAGLVAPGDRRAVSDAPYLLSPAACRAANSPYTILGLLPDPEGGLSDIPGLYLDKSSLLPARQRIFIQTVQQINGWRGLLPNHLGPHPHPVGPAPAKASTKPPVSSPSLGCARLGRAISPCIPPVYPLYTPSKPLVITFYSNRGGLQWVYRGITGGLMGD
jgi:hypothetical protein